MNSIKPRTAPVVIYQGDDLARLSALDDKVQRAETLMRMAERQAKNARTGAVPATLDEASTPELLVIERTTAYEEAVAERDAFAEEAEARGVKVVLRALPRREWRDLQNDHPGRPDNEEDRRFGNVNVDTLPEVLLPKSVDRAAEESTIDGDTSDFLEALSANDYYERLFLTAVALNKGDATADPTLRLGSLLSPTSDATSN